jgi:hypothetical protein
MSKNLSGTVTQFMYDRFNPVQELNSSGGVTANLLTGLGIDESMATQAKAWAEKHRIVVCSPLAEPPCPLR